MYKSGGCHLSRLMHVVLEWDVFSGSQLFFYAQTHCDLCISPSGWQGFRRRHRRHAGYTGSEEDQVFVPGAAGGVRRLFVSLHITWTLWSVSPLTIHLLLLSIKEQRTAMTCSTCLDCITNVSLLLFVQVSWTMTVLWTMMPAACAWQKWRWPTLKLVNLVSCFYYYYYFLVISIFGKQTLSNKHYPSFFSVRLSFWF